MRLIGTLNHPNLGLIFSSYLDRQGIANQLEVVLNQDWGSANYGITECRIWIQEEDQVEQAKLWLDKFLIEPNNPRFLPEPTTINMTPLKDPALSAIDPPVSQNSAKNHTPWDKQAMGWITRLLILICTILLVLSQLLVPKMEAQFDQTQFALFVSPVNKALLYDYPYYYQLVDRYLQLYGEENNPQDLPNEAHLLLNTIKKTPVWQGMYGLLLAKKDQKAELDQTEAPMFEKVRQGQLWRLFSPALLHADVFHLFFNMLWLIVLGKQIEQRLSSIKYILFVLILGIFSNTMQYLTSGPNFVGFSGVLCGMLTFIWERQKFAPWEGYELNRQTYLFMIIFILGMASIQFLSFFMEKSFNMAFSPNVANMAHLSGALMGYIVGKTTIFSWRQP